MSASEGRRITDLDPVLQPLAFLLGRWRGSGFGSWPTSGEFRYEEEMTFEPGGAGEDFPFLTYRERAWNPDDGLVLHSEQGFWTIDGDQVAVTLAHPIGVTEIAEGSVAGTHVQLSSRQIARASTGLAVVRLVRSYRAEGEHLRYEVQMATDDVPLMRHLRARLRRVDVTRSS